MAIDLKAVFRVRDEGTSKLRRIMQQTEKLSKSTQQATKATNTYRDATGRLRDSMGRFVSESNRASSANSRFSTSLSGVRVGAGGVSASLKGMQSALFGIVGAYVGAQGAAAAFNATIGAAAKYEQSEVAVNAIFNDKEASDAYLKMVDKMAIDSPLLSSGEMLSSSKGLVAMTKNVNDLGDAWGIIEKLMVLDPTQGTEGAAFALKEMWQGDSLSMVERFGLNKSELNRIKKLDIPSQIAEINKLLDGMGITESTVNSMGETTLGYWAQIQERAQKFMRTIGESGNSKLGDSLGKIVSMFDNTDMDGMATSLGDILGGIVDKAIVVGQWLWKWREPIAYIVGALAAATGAFMVIGAISLLANPVALIGAGVAALVVGFKALYDNSEPVRNVISGIVDKAKELIGAFQNGGASGLLDALLPPGAAEAMSARFTAIREQLTMAFQSISSIVVPILQAAWGLISPILTALSTALKIVGDVAMIAWNNVLAPAIEFVGAAFTMLWAIVGPILGFLGAAIEAAFGVLRLAWDTIIGPFVAFLGGAFATAFGMATEVVGALTPVFETLGGWISTAAGYLSEFADLIGKIEVPDWIGTISSKAVGWAKSLIPGKSRADGSHFHGLDRVPYDGYLATLHRNEMVLKADEADAYRKMMTNDSQTSEAVNSPITPMINNVLEPIINVAVNPTSSVFNEVNVNPTPINVGDGAVNNDYSYERVSNSIANQTTNNTYNNTNNQTTNNAVSGKQAQSQRPVTIQMSGVTVREEADINKIGWALFDRLAAAEGAGV